MMGFWKTAVCACSVVVLVDVAAQLSKGASVRLPFHKVQSDR